MKFALLPRRFIGRALIAILVASAVVRATAAEPEVGAFKGKIRTVNKALKEGGWELYATGYAWHLRGSYDDKAIDRLNETTWGGGFGRTGTDEDGDRHSVFFLAFSDSHKKAQFIASYAWQRYLWPKANFSPGWGYVAFFFSREDVANYLPIPAALPCVSLRYQKAEIVGLFVPHISKDIQGNMFFFFLRFDL